MLIEDNPKKYKVVQETLKLTRLWLVYDGKIADIENRELNAELINGSEEEGDSSTYKVVPLSDRNMTDRQFNKAAIEIKQNLMPEEPDPQPKKKRSRKKKADYSEIIKMVKKE